MSTAPIVHIDPVAFTTDPYPALKSMRANTPIAFVPELGATLFTKRDTIFTQEKRIEVFSSDQPGGLMTVLMGENLMRKDGEPHQAERKAIFPAISPRTVRDIWLAQFAEATDRVLDRLEAKGKGDLVHDFAMPVSAEALRVITGLSNMQNEEIDRTSQGMIDGISNYLGDAGIEANCRDCTASIDRHIDAMVPIYQAAPNPSLISVQMAAGLSDAQMRANVKLAISGGQNEPRDAIAGTIWALLSHPAQLLLVQSGQQDWLQAFEEYARWTSPIGMSPRRVAKPDTIDGIQFETDERVFFMFGSANRDEEIFDNPDAYDLTRDVGPSIAFGAGPHFCAGAWASRALISQVALPKVFARLKNLRLAAGAKPKPVGWAFRGLTALPCEWDV
ncbi:MAG: cytochrome P450 [Alphaproteobacteria bacterium]|nr:cytochrome P450 [Alphaproteobacteria bacterium]